MLLSFNDFLIDFHLHYTSHIIAKWLQRSMELKLYMCRQYTASLDTAANVDRSKLKSIMSIYFPTPANHTELIYTSKNQTELIILNGTDSFTVHFLCVSSG